MQKIAYHKQFDKVTKQFGMASYWSEIQIICDRHFEQGRVQETKV
jgi:hypothetical protein